MTSPHDHRPIKFRQRNKNNGQWRYWGFIDGQWVQPLLEDNFAAPEKSPQFTGLTDKNGKEIWEGDVIQHPDLKRPKNVDFDSQHGWLGNFPEGIDLSYAEVIGNIYENKDLLK